MAVIRRVGTALVIAFHMVIMVIETVVFALALIGLLYLFVLVHAEIQVWAAYGFGAWCSAMR